MAGRPAALGTAGPAIRAGLLCGILAPALWAAAIVVAGEARPGFDHVLQYISELGERGSRTEYFMRYAGFVATGLMHLAYAAAFAATLNRLGARRHLTLAVALLIGLNGLGRIGAGIFACEPGCLAPDVLTQRLHSLSATAAFLSMATACCLGAPLFRADRRLRPLAVYSLLSGLAGLVFLYLLSSGGSPAYAGLYERLASGALTLWVFVGAWRLLRLAGRR